MLSTFPASSDALLIGNTHGDVNSFFDGGFTPWECSEFISSLTTTTTTQHSTPAAATPVMSSSGSDELNPNSQPANSSNSDEPDRSDPVIDERKHRRKISNRESARRSRMRKQKHLENLRNQVNRLRVENRELTNRLRFVLYHFHRVRTDNDRLRSESTVLRQKLSDIRQFLLFRQLQQFPPSPAWPCNNVTSTYHVTSEQTPSIIT